MACPATPTVTGCRMIGKQITTWTGAIQAMRVWTPIWTATPTWSSGQAKLEFQAIANRSYAVEISDSPNNTSWRTMIETAPGLVNRSAIILDPGLTGTRFYRVVTPGPGQ
jgi:hypothetical protein